MIAAGVFQRGPSCFAAAVATITGVRFDELPEDALDPERADVWAVLDRWLRRSLGLSLRFVPSGGLERPSPPLRRFLTGRCVELDPARLDERPRYAAEASGGRFVVLLSSWDDRRGVVGHAAVGQAHAGRVVVVHDPAGTGWEPGTRAADMLTGLVFVVGASGLPEPPPWPRSTGRR